MSGERRPLSGGIQPNDHGPAVIVAIATGLLVSTAFTGVRVWIMSVGKIPFRGDDYLALLALVSGDALHVGTNVEADHCHPRPLFSHRV
jgi:hypothetical protein